MRAGQSANVTTGEYGVQPGRSADTTGGGAPDKMCGFQRLASRIATLPAAPTGLSRLRASARALTTPDHVQLFQTIQGFERVR
jgi:hypothetical protein